MIDHLFLYPDEATAVAARPEFYSELGWAANALPCRVIFDYDLVNVIYPPDGSVSSVSVPVYMDGFHLNVALHTVESDWLSDPYCVLITDRGRGVAGATRDQFVLHTKVSVATMNAVLGVEPAFLGSNYPFGAAE